MSFRLSHTFQAFVYIFLNAEVRELLFQALQCCPQSLDNTSSKHDGRRSTEQENLEMEDMEEGELIDDTGPDDVFKEETKLTKGNEDEKAIMYPS